MLKIHYWLGYAGLIPFISLTLLLHQTDSSFYYEVLLAYAALIFTFIAGIYWSHSMMQSMAKGIFISILSVSMMLFAWFWVLFPLVIPIWLISLSFFVLPWIERKWMHLEMSDDFLKLRTILSSIVALCLMSLVL